MARRLDTRQAILKASEQIIRSRGFAALTFDAVAQRLGVTKQAVIYWFPTKDALVSAILPPALEAEARAAITAIEAATSAAEAVALFVRALVTHHTANLDRFRVMYLAVQFTSRSDAFMNRNSIAAKIYPATSRMYGALEAKLAADPLLPSGLHPRRSAVAVHMAALGLITMVALAEAVDDPLAHRTDDLVDSLVALLNLGTNEKFK